ncbi:MAG: Fe-S protein assembly co-chaperone HscB [Gammaproteobacteria bacterium]
MTIDLKQDFFELFALPRDYSIDRPLLENRYREIQRAVHPDKFVNASDQERRVSMQQATLVNEAYETLIDPIERGRYLLSLTGITLDEESRSTQDIEFLGEQMELRESLAEIHTQAEPLAELDKMSATMNVRMSAMESELATRLQQSDTDEAIDLILKMQFYSKLQIEISELEADLEDELYG